MSKRRKLSAEFKAKVAIETLAGELTLAQLSSTYDVHPNVISNWKRQAQAFMVEVFAGKGEKSNKSHEEEVRDLHTKIGQLTIEKDFCRGPSLDGEHGSEAGPGGESTSSSAYNVNV